VKARLVLAEQLAYLFGPEGHARSFGRDTTDVYRVLVDHIESSEVVRVKFPDDRSCVVMQGGCLTVEQTDGSLNVLKKQFRTDAPTMLFSESLKAFIDAAKYESLACDFGVYPFHIILLKLKSFT
jgi:hypothetical protein